MGLKLRVPVFKLKGENVYGCYYIPCGYLVNTISWVLIFISHISHVVSNHLSLETPQT